MVQRKERQERLSQRAMSAFRRVGSYQPEKGAGKDYPRTNAEERTKKEMANKVLVLNKDFQLLKHTQ